jgi:hypothetical protein
MVLVKQKQEATKNLFSKISIIGQPKYKWQHQKKFTNQDNPDTAVACFRR